MIILKSMTLEYSITEEDYLTYLMHHSAKSKSLRNARQRMRLVVTAVYLVFALMLYLQGMMIGALLFVAGSVVVYMVYPKTAKKKYLKHYRRFIRENRSGQIGRRVSLSIDDAYIHASDEGGEAKVQLSEITDITELATIFMIKFKVGESFVIPKNEIADAEGLGQFLKALSEKLHVPYSAELDWKWA